MKKNKNKKVTFIFLSLGPLIQSDLFYFQSFIYKCHEFVFLYTWIVFHSLNMLHFNIHSIEIQLGCFPFLAIMNTEAVSPAEQVGMDYDVKLFGHTPRPGTPGSYEWRGSFFSFWRILHADFRGDQTCL